MSLLNAVPFFWRAAVVAACVGVANSAIAAAPAPEGRFRRDYWYEPGVEHGNPGAQFNSRFRVNDPQSGVGRFHSRAEVRSSGMMQVLLPEDLTAIVEPELYLELWGGHPGTTNHRVGINGRSLYPIEAAGTRAGQCEHLYPVIPLQKSDLVRGYNALQFACDIGQTFWGHFIVDNACLRVRVPSEDAAIREAGLGGFSAALRAERSPREPERISVWLEIPPAFHPHVAAVNFEGFYEGYDENGDGQTRDWHGFTKGRQPHSTLGVASAAPYQVVWDTTMLPAQSGVAVRATVKFRAPGNLHFEVPPLSGLEIPERRSARVRLHAPAELPKPFWSRASREKVCVIPLDVAPERIERAELHVVTWTGGPGKVRDYFTLNGQSFPVAEGSRHQVMYSVVALDPALLKRGENRIRVLSDTDHHGIEVLLPGPALVVRERLP